MILARIRNYLELIRFSHTIFALPFAFMGGALAAHSGGQWHSRAQDWLGILLCMATARTAAMAFNRLVDREYDALNPRTAMRHLPAGKLKVGAVAVFTALSSMAFLLSTLIFLPNRLPLLLAIPVLGWLLAYSYTKRFTSLAHLWLGISLGLAPIAAWIAIAGSLAWPPILLGLAVAAWVAGFDVIYACQDVDFDRAVGLSSIPRLLGIKGALLAAAALHAVMIVPLVTLGVIYPLGTLYFVGLAAAAALLIYEHALVRPDDLSRVNLAFFHVNAWISMGLLGVTLLDLVV